MEDRMADRETRKKQITARRQEQILKAAGVVFTRKGYAAATIPEIARSAGLAAGTIYLYYPGKRELFLATIQNLVVFPLVSIFEREADRDFPRTLQEALQERLQIVQNDFFPMLLSLLGEIQRDPELKDLFYRKLLQPFLSRMEAIYRSRIDNGEFRRMDPSIAVRMVGGMMVGMFLLRNIEGELSPLNRLSRKQLADEILNFVLSGLMAGKDKETSHE
jgi:AcrR family transcriptional regulator